MDYRSRKARTKRRLRALRRRQLRYLVGREDHFPRRRGRPVRRRLKLCARAVPEPVWWLVVFIFLLSLGYCDTAFAQGRRVTEANLPATCQTGRQYTVVDAGTADECTPGGAGGGSVEAICICDETGAAYYSVAGVEESAEIDSDVSTHSAVAGAHHAQFSPNADPGVDHSSYVAGHGDGANCSTAGHWPAGVDAAGAVQGCGSILPINPADQTTDGEIDFDSTEEVIEVGDDGVGTLKWYPNPHSTAADITLGGDVDGAGNANDLDELAVEAELEAVLDLADLQERAHASLTGVTSDLHHPQAHALDGADHTLSGATEKQVVAATGAAAFGLVWVRVRSHATDCTSLTGGKEGELCWEIDDNTLYVCEPSAGDCDTAGEWAAATAAGDGVGYDQVQEEGSNLTKRATVNFIGASVTCADNAGSSRTDCTLTDEWTDSGAGGTLTPNESNDDVQEDASTPTWQLAAAGHIGTDTRLRVGDADSDVNSACISVSADELYHDTDCDGTKDAGEEFIDQAGGGAETKRVSIINAWTVPDNSGEVYFQPFTVHATNDQWDNLVLVFDDGGSAQDCVNLKFQVPQDYSSAADFGIVWTTAATSNDVEWDFLYRAVGGNDTESLDQAGTQEASTNQNDTAPSAAFERLEFVWAATDGNFAAGDTVTAQVCRDKADAGDTLVDEALVFDIFFEYST